jgi:predicted tellurium resistance membrane protein TerC
MLTSIIGSIILLVFISKLFVLFLIDAILLYILPIAIISFIAILIGYNDSKKEDINTSIYIIMLSPFVYIFFSLLMIKSILEYIATWDGKWYKVEKKDK